MYDRTTVQGATFNMRRQLNCGHANVTALSSSPVVSALGSESHDPGSSPGWGKAFETCGKKKMRAPLLGLAKSIYYAGELVSSSPWFGRTCLLAYLTVKTLGIE